MKRTQDEDAGPSRKKGKEPERPKRRREEERDTPNKRSRNLVESPTQKLRKKVLEKYRRFRRIQNTNRLPTYDIDVTRADGNPHTITARPITTGSNNFSIPQAQRSVANVLRTYTRAVLTTSTGWTPRLVHRRFRGSLQVTNMMNSSSAQVYLLGSLKELDKKMVDEIFTNMQQSESDTPFEFLEWTVIIHPQTFEAGSGTITPLRKGPGWQNYYDAQGHINCAAVALTLLTKTNRFDKRPDLLKT